MNIPGIEEMISLTKEVIWDFDSGFAESSTKFINLDKSISYELQ